MNPKIYPRAGQRDDSTSVLLISSVWFGAWILLLSSAWLLPNHYLPWPAFHADAWCAVSFILIAAVVLLRTKSATTWYPSDLLIAFLVFVPWVQYSTGLISFSGQAWIASSYLLGFLLALQTGQRWEKACPDQLVGGLFWAIGIAAVVSVNLQLQTWLGLIETGIFDIWSMGLSSARPYANLGQPNQLGTLLLWGLLACAWVYTTQKIKGSVALLVACFLLLGIALTQSRTSWLGLTFLLVSSWYWRRLWPSKWVPWCVSALFLLFWGCYPLLKVIAELLLIDSESSYFRSQIQGDLRLPAWRLFAGAVLERPWFGYGWSEVGHAQLNVATNFPALFPTFGHAHNLFLDLVLWLGLPIGLFVSLALVGWFGFAVRAVAQAGDAILVMCLGVIGIHAMLEFPLHYAYFLLPVGLVVGGLNQRLGYRPILNTPRWTLMGVWLVAALMLTGIIRDYFRVESSFQTARFELARIGNLPVGDPPDVLLLTQLRERIAYMRYEVKSGMTPEELDWLIKVVNAYPGGGVAYKAARALALNNRPAEAQQWLKKVCKISSPQECDLIKRVWAQDGRINPLIAAVVWQD